MPERRTRRVSKQDAHAFISKAEQFLRTMERRPLKQATGMRWA